MKEKGKRERERERNREGGGEIRREREKVAPSSEEELRERTCRLEEDPLVPMEGSGQGLALTGSGYQGDRTNHYILILFL